MDILAKIGVQRWRLRNGEECLPSELKVAAKDGDQVASPMLDQTNPGWLEIEQVLHDKAHCVACSASTPLLGEGDKNADWMFVFSAPSAQDIQHQSLLGGRRGQLFDAILQSIGLQRSQVYLTSMYKCAVDDNSAPHASCERLVHQQIDCVQPQLIVTFGEPVYRHILRTNGSSSDSAGVKHNSAGQPVYSAPALDEVLHEPQRKSEIWATLKRALDPEHRAG